MSRPTEDFDSYTPVDLHDYVMREVDKRFSWTKSARVRQLEDLLKNLSEVDRKEVEEEYQRLKAELPQKGLGDICGYEQESG